MSSAGASCVRIAFIALSFAAADGCTTKHVLPAADLAGSSNVVHVGDSVRATTTANITHEFELVSVDADSTLHGVTPDGAMVSVRASDLTSLEYRTKAPGKSALLGIAIFMGVGSVFHGCSEESHPFPCDGSDY
jgi:hypothetical protein